jgi:hypothetical protein
MQIVGLNLGRRIEDNFRTFRVRSVWVTSIEIGIHVAETLPCQRTGPTMSQLPRIVQDGPLFRFEDAEYEC